MTPDEIQKIVETAIEQRMMFPWWAYALWAVIPFVSCFIAVYLKEKGKNLATKEDISEITKKIEAEKLQYSTKLESVKTTLGSKLFINQVRYQNEFDLLTSLSEKLASLREALSNFEVQVLSTPTISTIFGKAKEVLAAMSALSKEYEEHKPFYPEDIYEGLHKLHGLAFSEFTLKANDANLIEKWDDQEILIDSIKQKIKESKESNIGINCCYRISLCQSVTSNKIESFKTVITCWR